MPTHSSRASPAVTKTVQKLRGPKVNRTTLGNGSVRDKIGRKSCPRRSSLCPFNDAVFGPNRPGFLSFPAFCLSKVVPWSSVPPVGPSVCSPVRRRPLAFGCSRLLATRSGAPSLWAPSPPRVADQSYSWLRLVFERLVHFIRPSRCA